MNELFTKKRVKTVVFIMLATLFANILLPVTQVFASESNPLNQLENISTEQLELVMEQILDYSEYDSEQQTWVLDYQIVEDGIFTEQQYLDAEESAQQWNELYSSMGKQTRFVLPALLVTAIKAVGAIVGATIATEITTYFMNWGLSAGCKKFKKYSWIKSFCSANGH